MQKITVTRQGTLNHGRGRFDKAFEVITVTLSPGTRAEPC
jgi:hypothetical protein